MIRACRFLPCVAAVLTTAVAQTTQESAPFVRADTVIVEDVRFVADATGTTRVQLDDAAMPTTAAMSNLAGRLANFHVNTGGAGSFGDLFAVRGLTNTPYFSDPSITVYFDDLPLSGSATYPTGLFGFASATLHRGPQATAVGRAGEGGVLMFSSADVTALAGGELRASAGNFAARSVALSARSARSDKVDAAVSAAYNERDGFIQNTELGQRVDDQQSTAVSARVRVRPTATSELTFQFLGSRLRNGAQPLVPLDGPLFSVARGREGETGVDFGGGAFKAAFDTALGRLSATTSYTDWELNPFTNRLVLPPTLDSSVVQAQRTWNEEIRLTSNPQSALAWTAGAWFSDAHTTGHVQREIPDLFPIEVSQHEANARTLALFGEAVVFAAGDWQVTAGARAEQVKKDFDRSQTVPGPGRFTAEKTFNAFLPKLAARYALSPGTSASVSISAGTKPGGWSAFTGDPTLAPFSAERTIAFEGGLDTSLANKTVTLTARGFVYAIRDYQIERSFTQSDYIVVNAPRARSIGAELEATWRPVPAWTLAATVGLTDVTLREFTDPFTGTNYSGKRAPYTPAYDANLSATYREGSGWFAGAEVSFVGKTYYDESEDSAFAQGERATVNARLGYEAARWRVSLYGENLTDEAYYSLIIPGVGHAVPGSPRTYGVEVTAKW